MPCYSYERCVAPSLNRNIGSKRWGCSIASAAPEIACGVVSSAAATHWTHAANPTKHETDNNKIWYVLKLRINQN